LGRGHRGWLASFGAALWIMQRPIEAVLEAHRTQTGSTRRGHSGGRSWWPRCWRPCRSDPLQVSKTEALPLLRGSSATGGALALRPSLPRMQQAIHPWAAHGQHQRFQKPLATHSAEPLPQKKPTHEQVVADFQGVLAAQLVHRGGAELLNVRHEGVAAQARLRGGGARQAGDGAVVDLLSGGIRLGRGRQRGGEVGRQVSEWWEVGAGGACSAAQQAKCASRAETRNHKSSCPLPALCTPSPCEASVLTSAQVPLAMWTSFPTWWYPRSEGGSISGTTSPWAEKLRQAGSAGRQGVRKQRRAAGTCSLPCGQPSSALCGAASAPRGIDCRSPQLSTVRQATKNAAVVWHAQNYECCPPLTAGSCRAGPACGTPPQSARRRGGRKPRCTQLHGGHGYLSVQHQCSSTRHGSSDWAPRIRGNNGPSGS